MSLINQMLRDLEQRRSQDNPADGYPAGTVHQYSAAKNKFSLVRVFVVIIVLLIAIVGYLVWDRNNTPSAVSINSESTIPARQVESSVQADSKVVEVVSEPEVDITPPAKQLELMPVEEQLQVTRTNNEPAQVVQQQAVASLQVVSVSPDPVPASLKRQTITINGEGFTKETRIMVKWDKRQKTLPASQAQFVSANQLIMSIVVGPRENIWTVQVFDPVKGHSAQLDFSVVSEQLLAGTAVTKTARPLDSKQRGEVLYQEGYQLLSKGHAHAGEQKLLDAIAIYPGHIKAREILAGTYIKSGRVIEAGDLLQEGSELVPEHALFTQLQARLMLEQNQLQQAIELLEKKAPAVNIHPQYHALLAAAYQRNKQHVRAVEQYQAVLKVVPVSGVWWVGMAISLEALGQQAEARQAYQQAKNTGRLTAELLRYTDHRLVALRDSGLPTEKRSPE